MRYSTPGKTFLIGEYVAINGGPAILLASGPEFTLSRLDTQKGLINIHPESPAGQWYAAQTNKPDGLIFNDPYQGKGGLGASSAQFVLVYQAVKQWQSQNWCENDLLQDYYQFSWDGQGSKPSGYDLLLQSNKSSMIIDLNLGLTHPVQWPFREMSCVLIHTGKKLATHKHLSEQRLPELDALKTISYQAIEAWKERHAINLVDAVNHYYQQLLCQLLVAPHTKSMVETLMAWDGVYAAKGCGALGADVILAFVKNRDLSSIRQKITENDWHYLATISNKIS